MNTTAPTLSANTTQASAFAQILRRTAQALIGIALVHNLVIGTFNWLDSPDARLFIGVEMFAFALAYVTWFVLAQLEQIPIAASGLVVTLFLELWLGGIVTLTSSIILVVVIATLVSNRWLYYLYNIVTFTMITVVVLTGDAGLADTTTTIITGGEGVVEEIALLITLLGVSTTTRYFRQNIEQSVADTEKNADLLRISAEVGSITAGITTLDELLPQAVNFIRDRFGYYHVQVFLLDDSGEVAVLRASTGKIGQQLLARKHRLNVGSESVIGRVTQTGQPLNYDDTGAQGVHYRNELLPNTRSELALPIRDGERIIGALDVQSIQPRAFNSNQVQSLQIMTNLLAAAIRNVQLFEDQQQSVQENQRLYIETQANLREIQRLNRELTKDGWQRFTAEMGEHNGVTLQGNRLEWESSWSQLAQQAGQTRQPVTDTEGRYVIAVPIILRGEVIGALEVEPDSSLEENSTVEIVRAVAERLAVGLDNARLYEESQETTLYEQRINQIVGQYQGANTVDQLLQITISELAQSLGAERGAIRLSTAPPEDDDTTTNGYKGASHG